jgi:hypothetical protein
MTIVDWIRTNTNGIGTTIQLGMSMLLGFGWLRTAGGDPWSDAQMGLVLGFVSGVLGLITQKTTVASIKVDERVKEAKVKGLEQGVKIEEARAEGLRMGTDPGRSTYDGR